MPVYVEKYKQLQKELTNKCTIVAVSKKQDIEKIRTLYDMGHRHFGESYVQELCQKKDDLPDNIHWHFIGHLQRNKVKYIAPFVHTIQSVDSISLLDEIEKQATKSERTINILLQVYIAKEETKFGFSPTTLEACIQHIQDKQYTHIKLKGLMGMATFSEDNNLVKEEFEALYQLFKKYQSIDAIAMDTLSMGMTHDYGIALTAGSNMIRLGSLLFGKRT